jgi:hypothetical protein
MILVYIYVTITREEVTRSMNIHTICNKDLQINFIFDRYFGSIKNQIFLF